MVAAKMIVIILEIGNDTDSGNETQEMTFSNHDDCTPGMKKIVLHNK